MDGGNIGNGNREGLGDDDGGGSAIAPCTGCRRC